MDDVPDGFKTTEVGTLPEEWGVVGLGDVTEKTKQKDPRKTPEWRFKYVDVSSISRDAMKIAEYKLCRGNDAPSRAKKLVKKNDVIFATVRPTLKRLTLIDEEFDGEICSTAFCVLRAMENTLSPSYMFYTIQTDAFMDELEKIQRGASYPAVTDSDIKNQKIPLPPIPEQHRIAAVLSAVQDAKEKTEAVIAAAKSLKKSLMRHLFTYGPVSSGAAESVPLTETEIGLVPEGWGVGRLKDITREKIKNGAFIKRNRFGGGMHFLNVADTYNRLNIDFRGLERVQCTGEELKLYSIQPNDLFYVRSSLKREGVGQCCIAECVPEPSIYDCHLMRVRVDIEKIAPEFIAYYSTTTRGKQALIARSKTTTMTTINQSGLASFLIPMPPLPIQQKIASILSTVDKKIEAEENKKKALDELFRSLLRNLMTGKIRVNHLEAIP